MLTEKDYCDYETCVALKELGFSQYHSHRIYAGEGGVWILNFEGEPNYNEGELILQEDLFDVPRDGNEVAAPLLYEAQKFLREEKKIDANAFYDNMDAAWRFYVLEIDSPDLSGTHAYNDAYMSYEEALSEGIKVAVKILKENETIHE